MIIPELEEESKTYHPTGVRAYSDDEDDTLLRYFGKVSKNSLMKHFPGKTYDALGGHYRRILKQRKKKGTILVKTPDAAPVHIPTDGLQGGAQPAGTPPIKKKLGLNSITSRGNLNRKGKGKHGDLKIPFSSITQGREYARAYRLCLKHRCTYPEVLALENKSVENIQKSTEKVPEKGTGSTSKSGLVVRKQKALPLHQKNHESEDPAKGARAQEIHIKDVAITQPQSETRSPLLDPLVIVSGLTVKQVKPDGGRQMYGNGMVVARRGEICEVRNNGKTYHILAACLEIVRGPEKTGDAVGAES